ncbi:phosphoinositide 3-kinase regulatory subunit 4 [Chironomus tepperi]|uniref:phosphoinositide 3-kinase regulatory subunit 4 n=1 Tax=Chironomus tepperi TaxID=113505 RepID=UPI00391F28C8
MGNQLSTAPIQIFPVEHYFLGMENEIQFESSMGCTRFFKVARGKSEEGLLVVKVFVKHDPSLPLEIHADKIESIKKGLQNAVNCLPFQRVVLTDKTGIIVREYVKHSLYDRMSTRPFLTLIEKKWITFQVLCALHQCHKQKICHGDIKLENIMITSWNWILLSDFASFKPTFLPDDNPADYSYFFDTSRRRTCYIAPERFTKSFTVDSNNPLVGDTSNSGNLVPEMDIFSAGCALLELWTEGIGTAPFEFSQLLTYRNGENQLVNRHLNALEDENLRNLLSSMLSINPKDRKSAEIYLDMERGRLFPEYFYSFLQSYIPITFSSIPIVPNDDKIMRLHADVTQIVDIITKDNLEDDGLILITTLVTSCIRGLNHCSSKIHCLEILYKLAQHTSSETILDRILPYILHLCQDSSPNVRVAALDTLTQCLCLVTKLPRSDANVFPEYVLPAISNLAVDPATIVRISYAQNIAILAETAVKFLEQSQLGTMDGPLPNYETELHDLHEMLSTTVMSLLTDSQVVVKQTLMESGINKLCVFFGSQKANDIILSHVITFLNSLNEKDDKNLRGTFFDCIVGIATYVGWHCSPILIPLLQQGFSDPEEFVIAKAIRATTALTEIGLLQKTSLIDFINEIACFLNHPNLWIRHEICGLISMAAKMLTPLDVQCKIMPSVAPHLKCPLIQIEKIELLLDSLNPAIPRSVYETVLKFNDIPQFIEILKERKQARAKAGQDGIPKYGEMIQSMRTFFRRLASIEGMSDLVEMQLLSMNHHLIKMAKYRSHERKSQRIVDGRIQLDKNHINHLHEFMLSDKMTGKNEAVTTGRKHRISESASVDWILNQEFPSISQPDTNAQPIITQTPNLSLVEFSMPERSFQQERLAECRVELDQLFQRLKAKHTKTTVRHEALVDDGNSPNWKFNGTLVAHLCEHKGAVTRMTTLKPGGTSFASVSNDGYVRLWDCSKLDGHQNINRSRQFYAANTPLNAVAACDNGQSLAVAGKDGALLVLRIDPNSSKMALQQARHLDSNARIDRTTREQDDGPVVEMQSKDQSQIVYATLYGAIVGWDLRMPSTMNSWRLQSDLRNGVITTFTIDPINSSWLTIGTSSGRHLCWDLRFLLKIAEIKHPHESRIRRVCPHPTEPSCLISASQGNNEVFSWNIETNSRQTALWASQAPPLSNTNSTTHSVCALLPGRSNGRGFLITAGTDQRIRYWDLQDASNCRLVVPAPKDYSPSSISYDSRLIDGTYVIQETYNGSQSPSHNSTIPRGGGMDESTKAGTEISVGHNDVITDLVMCKTQKQTFIASSSRDGVIKLWK